MPSRMWKNKLKIVAIIATVVAGVVAYKKMYEKKHPVQKNAKHEGEPNDHRWN